MIDYQFFLRAFPNPNFLGDLDNPLNCWRKIITNTLPNHSPKKIDESMNERYKDEYPIIWFEPNLSSTVKRSILPLLRKNNSLNYFANFQHALESIQKFIALNIGFILIVPTNYQEQNLFRDFRILKKIFGFRLSRLEEKFLQEKLSKEGHPFDIGSKRAYVFYTRKGFDIEAPADKKEKEVIIMNDKKELVKEFREELWIWYDPSLPIPSKKDFEESLPVDQGSIFIYNFDELSKKIQTDQNYPYHLILTKKEDEAIKIIQAVGDVKALMKIFVCSNGPKKLGIKHDKVVKVKEDIKVLFPEIKKEIERRNKFDLPAFRTFSDTHDKQHNYDSHILLKNLNFANQDQARDDFNNLARQVYPTKEKDILKFEKDYTEYNKVKILHWYTRISHVNKLMNNCLRIATPDSLLCARFVFKHMEKAIREHYQEESKNFVGMVYRVAYLSQDELTKFERSQGQEIEMLGFMSTSKSRQRAMNLWNKDKVLIEIIIPPFLELDPQGFADVTNISRVKEEQEILFNVRSRFQVLGTDLIKESKKEYRRVLLLYVGSTLISDQMKSKLSSRIKIKFPSFFKRKCQRCPNEYNLYLNYKKNKIHCRKCLIQNDRLEYISLGKISKKKNLTGSNSQKHKQGWKCDDCGEITREINFKNWSAERKKMPHKNCTNCFQHSKNRKLDFSLLTGENPKVLWLEDNGGYGMATFDFKNSFPSDSNRMSQGDLFLEVKKYKECLEYCQRRLEQIFTKRWREQERLRIYDLLGKCSKYLELGEEAKEYLLSNFEMTKSIFGKGHPKTAISSHNVAILYKYLKENSNALKYFQYTLEVTESFYRKRSLKTVEALTTLAAMEMVSVETNKAIKNFKTALNIILKINGKTHSNTAIAFQNLSNAYQSSGREEEAITYFRKALGASKVISRRKSPSKVALYNLLATVFLSCQTHKNLRDEQNLLGQFLRSFKETKQLLTETIPQVRSSIQDFAEIYKILGEIQKGLEHSLEPLDHREITFCKESINSAVLCTGLGNIYKTFGQNQNSLGQLLNSPVFLKKSNDCFKKAADCFQTAVGCFEKALHLRKSIYGEIHRDIAISYKNLSSICFILKKKSEARDFDKRVSDILKKINESEGRFPNFEEEEEKLLVSNFSKKNYESISSFLRGLYRRSFRNNWISQRIYPSNHVQMECFYLQKCFENLKSRKLNDRKDLSIIETIHKNLAGLHRSLERYPKALEHAQKALNIEESLNGKSHSATVSFKNRLILTNYRIYGDKIALESHRDELKTRESSYNQKNLSTMLIYYNDLALTDEHLKEYSESLFYREKAFQLSMSLYKKDHPETASSYNRIAILYETLERYEKSLDNYHEALIIMQGICRGNHLDIAILFNNIASVKMILAKYKEASDYFETALRIVQAINGEKHPNIAVFHLKRASISQCQTDYDQMLKNSQKAVEIYELTHGENHPSTAAALNNVGMAYNGKENLKEAEQNFLKALQISTSIYGGIKHFNIAASYDNLAHVFAKQEKHEKALSFSLRALEITRSIYGKDHSETASSLNNFASFHGIIGNHERALEYHKEALKITRFVHGEKHPQTALSYQNIALVYKRKGEKQEAFDHFEKALQSCESAQEHPPSYIANICNNFAALYVDFKEKTKAFNLFEKALHIKQNSLGENHPETRALYQNLSSVKEIFEESKEAYEYHSKAHKENIQGIADKKKRSRWK